jgi:hypothetical protein
MGLDQRGFLRSTRGWIASFAPGSAAFAGTVVKVHGRMSAGVAAISGGRHVLRVRADYLRAERAGEGQADRRSRRSRRSL